MASPGLVSDWMPLWRVHGDGRTLLTKRGDPLAVIALAGLDFEGMSDEARESHVHHVANMLRTLDLSTRLYHYLSKSRDGDLHGRPVYRLEVHVALVINANARAPRRFWSNREAVWASAIASAVDVLEAQVRLVTSRLDAFKPTVLDLSQSFAFLARLVNGPDTTVHLLESERLDYQLAGEPIDVALKGELLIGRVPAQLLAMKASPRATYPLMLHELYGLDGEFVCCLQWQRADNATVKADIGFRRMHNKSYDKQHVAAKNAQLTSAQDAMTIDGHAFGDCSVSIALRGDNASRLAADAQRIIATYDGALIRETFYAVNTWASMLPGNYDELRHQLKLTDGNAADLCCLFSVIKGAPRAITTLRTQQGTPFEFSLHVQDVGHTLILGQPGSGKTTLMHVIADAAAKRENPRIIIFDLGHGYRTLADHLGGRYASFEQGQLPALNPFAGEPTAEHLFFLNAFCTVLAEGIGGERLDDAQREDLYGQIVNLFVLPPHMHRLGVLVDTLRPDLKRRFRPWVGDGMYANVFDHEVDKLTVLDCQVFEFDGLEDHPQLLAPLLFYVLHRVNSRVSVERMTLCLMDEAWRFLSHPMLREYVKAALKTWRKHNGVMVMASQALEDFANADLLQTAVESCPTVLLLANPLRNRDLYKSTFGLNDREMAMLADLRPKGQVFMKRPDASKVFDVVPLEM